MMQRIVLLKLVCLIVFTGSNPNDAMGQGIGVDREAMASLISEWDFANNSHSRESFLNVYGDTLLFYTETLAEARAVALKERLFRQRPGFRQRISTDITYTPFTTGLTKCEFTKEVLERGNWKAYPSYLLVSYKDSEYHIVGESDYETDRLLGFTLEIGKPIEFANAGDESDFSHRSDVSSGEEESLPFEMDTAIASLDSLMKPLDPIAIFPKLSTMGVVIVPKGYIILLVGFLLIGGLLIFIADSIHSRRGQKAVIRKKHHKRTQPGHDYQMQSVFESFVITLFDPLYFRHSKPGKRVVTAGDYRPVESAPNLEFEFRQKETHARFAVRCHYFKSVGTEEIQLFPPGRYQRFRDFENATGLSLYFILGFGGVPDDPEELFLVPANDLKREVVRKEAIRRYSKSGMFFYNRTSGRLQ